MKKIEIHINAVRAMLQCKYRLLNRGVNVCQEQVSAYEQQVKQKGSIK